VTYSHNVALRTVTTVVAVGIVVTMIVISKRRSAAMRPSAPDEVPVEVTGAGGGSAGAVEAGRDTPAGTDSTGATGVASDDAEKAARAKR